MATFFNQASLTYGNGTINSNTVSGELVEVISATKNTLQRAYRNGEPITYVINLQNTGNTTISGLTITDNLGAFNPPTIPPIGGVPALRFVLNSLQYYSNGVLQNTPTITETNPLTITGISIPANGNASILYQTTLSEYAPLDTGSTITNQATISGAPLTDDIVLTHTIPVDATPLLSISKSICPDTVTPNSEITYTFTIYNRGNLTAGTADAIIVSDTFNPILRNLSVTYNGSPWAPINDYAYDENTGVFESVAGQITVPAATYTQDPVTGEITTTPGISTLKVTGTV